MCNQKTKDMNRVKSFVWVLWLLCAAVLYPGCSREVISSPDSSAETDGGRTEAGSLRIVIRTPSPDDVINPGSRASAGGGQATIPDEQQEWMVKTLGVYIFMASAPGAPDTDYHLVQKTENIEFVATGVPGVSGTDLGNGEYRYTEPLQQYMLTKYLKVLLVANEGKELGDENPDGVSGTNLQNFKRLTAKAELTDTEVQRADVISGGVYNENDPVNESYKGIVMSGVAKKGTTEEIHLKSAATLELEALLTRNVARIDICLNKKKLILKNVVLKNTAMKAYLFPQNTPVAAGGNLLKNYPLLPISKYAELLGDGKKGIAYQNPASDTEVEEVTRERNTLKHVFYLYEQINEEGNSAIIEVTYTLPDADGKEQEGVLSIPFKTLSDLGETYVNTQRNHLYTVVLGDGSLDGKVVFRIDVDDWEPNEIHEYLPDDETEAVPAQS